MKRQSDDIDALIELMRSQYVKMRTQYSEELNEIEAAFKKEREDILERNSKEIKSLFETDKQHEDDYITKRADMEEEQAKELEEQRTREANDQQEQKIKLENEM